MRTTQEALQRKVSAVIVNTVAGPPIASSSAPSAGPTNEPMLSRVLDETFAAVSSSGDRARVGNIADSAGRKTVPTAVARVARAYTISAGPCVAVTTAAVPRATARATSDVSMTCSR